MFLQAASIRLSCLLVAGRGQ